MKFLSPEVALYLYESTICQCMEYCCHVWAGATSCYLELLDKLQKPICRNVGPSLAASLEPWLMWTASVFSRSITLVDVLQNWLNWLQLAFSRGRSTPYSDRLRDFLVTIPRCCKDVYVNSSFPCKAQLWNSLLRECFPLTLVALSLKLTDIF